jgi:hypothetical protein
MNHLYQPFGFLLAWLWLFVPESGYAQRDLLKLRMGKGYLPYEAQFGWNAELQYEHLFPYDITVFSAAGINTANVTYEGESKGRPWSYTARERFYYADLGLKVGVFPTRERFAMKLGVGVSYGHSSYQYAESLYIKNGAVTSRADARQNVGVFMGLAALDTDVYLNDHLLIGCQASFRTQLQKKFELKRILVVDNSTVITNSGISWIATFSLHLGYRF